MALYQTKSSQDNCFDRWATALLFSSNCRLMKCGSVRSVIELERTPIRHCLSQKKYRQDASNCLRNRRWTYPDFVALISSLQYRIFQLKWHRNEWRRTANISVTKSSMHSYEWPTMPCQSLAAPQKIEKERRWTFVSLVKSLIIFCIIMIKERLRRCLLLVVWKESCFYTRLLPAMEDRSLTTFLSLNRGG